MTAKELEKLVFDKAKDFGLITQDIKIKEGKRGAINAVFRSNISDNTYSDGKGGPYFGFISPEEAESGAYSDFSFGVFPQKEKGKCVIALGVGSLGFKNDLADAKLPGLRRCFLRLSDTKNSFIKNDFSDINSVLSDLIEEVNKNEDINDYLKHTIYKYQTVLSAARIVNPDNEIDVIYAWLALYAEYRKWPTNNVQRKNIEDAQSKYIKGQSASTDDTKVIKELLDTYKYVVIQGAPGVGKTYTANQIAENFNAVEFIQFHAETSYSDFVYGIMPDVNSSSLTYKANEGALCKAINKAKKTKGKVLLVIDEINRANLANVLGPVFYLFEANSGNIRQTLSIGNTELSQLPDNLYVLATMNTADRSLAVVDFALRRRFCWYTMEPHKINAPVGMKFHEDDFNMIGKIFDKYATDFELNLQPGPSYFLTSNSANADNAMRQRLQYELMPLIKEYLDEGLLLSAKDEFSHYFRTRVGINLYK